MTTNPPTSTDESIFDWYFEYLKDTESPMIYNRWSMVGAIGAALGRKYWMPFGTGRIFPNMYIMLIGSAGARKSTGIKAVRKLLSETGYNTFAAERSSKEKFLLDLQGEPDGPEQTSTRQNGRVSSGDVLSNLGFIDGAASHDGIPREIFIVADEFNIFAGSGNLDFLSLLGTLWDWDDESSTFQQRVKNSKSISIYQPTVSLLSANTHAGFQEAFPAAAIGQGFLSRLLLIYGEPSGKRIAFPSVADDSLRSKLVQRLRDIQTLVSGPCGFTAKSRLMLERIYQTWSDIEDARFASYGTRRQTYLLKLCLVCAASRVSTLIEERDVLLANSMLTWAEASMDKALGEFGKSRNSDATHAIMTKLYSAKAPINHEELWKVVQRDLDRREQMNELLANLRAADKIQWFDSGKSSGFLAKRKPADNRGLYVSFGLLKEAGINKL